MPRPTAVVAFLPLLLVAALAFGQAPEPRQPQQPGAGPALVQAGDSAAREGTRARTDADARECLEFVTNTGVIRCAERYRHRGAAPTH